MFCVLYRRGGSTFAVEADKELSAVGSAVQEEIIEFSGAGVLDTVNYMWCMHVCVLASNLISVLHFR